MNTQSTSLPEPKSIQLENGRAILLPSGELSIIQKGGKSVFLEVEDLEKIVSIADGGWESILNPVNKPLQFPELPEGEEWSNPDNLTPEQFGEGYRPLLKSEVKANLLAPYGVDKYQHWVVVCKVWSDILLSGVCDDVTYRTTLPLPTPKAKEEPKHIGCWQDGVIAQQSRDWMVGQRAIANFLRGCRAIVMLNPAEKWEPFGNEIPTIVVCRGVTEKLGEISPDLTWDAYNGETFPINLACIRSITV